MQGVSWILIKTGYVRCKLLVHVRHLRHLGGVSSSRQGMPRMTSPFGFDPDGFKTAPMRRLAAYWLSKCTADRLPSRAAILPEEIVRDLPFVYLVDVLDEPPPFRFRLVGTQVSIWSERDYTGTTLNAAEYGPKWEPKI